MNKLLKEFTRKEKMKKFKRTPMGNLLLEGDGFDISYRKNTNFLNIDSFAGDDNGEGETAICYGITYKILNGDFRKDYAKLIDKGLDKCLEFYESKKEEYSSCWSDE